MADTYPIIEVESETRIATEQLGSKPKFWFRREHQDWLFKEARENTGEDWAEKVASTIAKRIGIQTHHTELAVWNGKRGCAVRSFIKPRETFLVHGNELLKRTVAGYDPEVVFGQSDHTVENIVAAIERFFPSEKSRQIAATSMVGYMVLDALIGNTDRHHQNWGVVLSRASPQSKVYRIELAPTFDHASSLGRELTDAKRDSILGEGSITSYVERGRGGIFEDPNAKRGMSPLDVARRVARDYPAFFKHWQSRLRKLPHRFWADIVTCVPSERMSESSRLFADAMLTENRKILEELL